MPRIEDYVTMTNYKGFYRLWDESEFKMMRSFKDGLLYSLISVPTTKVMLFPVDRVMSSGQSMMFADSNTNTSFKKILFKTSYGSILPHLGKCMSQGVLTFSFFKCLREAVNDPQDSQTVKVLKSTVTGSVAGFLSTVLTYPVESSYKHLVIDEGRHYRHPGLLKALEYRYIEGGRRAMYQGLSVSLVGSMLFRGIYFGGFEWIKNLNGITREDSIQTVYPCALVSTALAIIVTHPLDSIRMNYIAASYNNVYHFNSVGPFDYAWSKMTPIKFIKGLHWNLGKTFSSAAALVVFDRILAKYS